MYNDRQHQPRMMTVRAVISPRIVFTAGLALALAAPCYSVAAQAADSTAMPSLELLALEAGRASRRSPIATVAPTMLCELAHPLVDSASAAGCAALDSIRAATITAAFARGLQVPLATKSDDDATLDLAVCPPDLDRATGAPLLRARITAPIVGMLDGRWEGRLTVELRCRSDAAGNGDGIRTIGREYLYQWNGREWRLYQYSSWRAVR